MGKTSVRLQVAAFIAVFAICQPLQSSVAAPSDGDWKILLSTLTGTREMTGHFESDGPVLSGYLSSPEGRTSFTGTVEGNRLRFDVNVVKPVKITLKYDIEVDGDRLVGKVKMGIFGAGQVKGERTKTLAGVME
jgi:aerobic carbon-monoxide dehydrogenase large subunit